MPLCYALSTFGHQYNTNTNYNHLNVVNKKPIPILAIWKMSIKFQYQFWSCAEQFPTITILNQYWVFGVGIDRYDHTDTDTDYPPPFKSMYLNVKDMELAAALNLAEIRGLDDVSEATLPTAFIFAEHITHLA